MIGPSPPLFRRSRRRAQPSRPFDDSRSTPSSASSTTNSSSRPSTTSSRRRSSVAVKLDENRRRRRANAYLRFRERLVELDATAIDATRYVADEDDVLRPYRGRGGARRCHRRRPPHKVTTIERWRRDVKRRARRQKTDALDARANSAAAIARRLAARRVRSARDHPLSPSLLPSMPSRAPPRRLVLNYESVVVGRRRRSSPSRNARRRGSAHRTGRRR